MNIENIIQAVRTQLESSVQKIYGPWPKKPQNNEFVENELEIQVLMSWIIIIVDSNDNKVRTGSLYLNKVVIGPVQGDQFLLVFWIGLPIRSILLPSSLSPFFGSPTIKVSPLFYTILFLLFPLSTCRFRLVTLIFFPSTPP